MAGISSNALNFGNLDNKRGYNGGNELQSGEFSDGSGLNWYDAEHRMYDPQIGRFGQVDKLADVGHNFSPYAFANDNPINYNDPYGLAAGDTATQNLPEVVVSSTLFPLHNTPQPQSGRSTRF